MLTGRLSCTQMTFRSVHNPAQTPAGPLTLEGFHGGPLRTDGFAVFIAIGSEGRQLAETYEDEEGYEWGAGTFGEPQAVLLEPARVIARDA